MSGVVLTMAQREALRQLVARYEHDGEGVRCDSLAGLVLAELPPTYIKRETWDGLFTPRFFPTDAGRDALKGGSE